MKKDIDLSISLCKMMLNDRLLALDHNNANVNDNLNRLLDLGH